MRIIHINDITKEMKLAKAIYRENDILLNIGCKKLHLFKNKLLSLGIEYIYVHDKISSDIFINNIIDDSTRIKGQKLIKETMNNIALNNKINIGEINNLSKEIVEQILINNDTLVNLLNIHSYDSYTFSHSISVSTLSTLLAKSLGYNKANLVKLCTGALLHDIGKIFIPKEILNSRSSLSPEEFKIIKNHPSLGYNALKSHHDISPLSKIVVLAHHEKVNGSGYPKGLKGDKIHQFAKIVAIADVFDALISNRCYHKGKSIIHAVEFLIANSNIHFEEKLVKEFIKHISLYPNGTTVQLSNGQLAIVKDQNCSFPDRPIIKTITDKEGNKLKLEKVQTINLLNINNLTIINDNNLIKKSI